MNEDPMLVTIVGAGRYGLSLILPKYRRRPDIRLKGIISPNAAKNRVARSLPSDVPLSRTPAEWAQLHGPPTDSDVFDLCVHISAIPLVLEQLAAIGAKNFILPKTIALGREDKDALDRLIAANGLNAVLASQYHDCRLTRELRDLVQHARRSRKIRKVEANFSQCFSAEKLSRYTPTTAVLPHMLQVLHSAGLLESVPAAPLRLLSLSREKIVLGRPASGDLPELRLESDLKSPDKIQSVKIYFGDDAAPGIVADYAGVFQEGRFIEYPSLVRDGKATPIVEDPLEAMVDKIARSFHAKRFGREDAGVLTCSGYEPLARAQLEIESLTRKSVAVIGGGIFGLLSALEAAKLGHHVVVFEKNTDVMLEASLVNQCRVHMGYHYPRDIATSNTCLDAMGEFCEVFRDGTVQGFDNYYCLAEEGSLTTQEDYVAFCAKMKLPLKEEWPTAVEVSKKKVAVAYKIPEPRFDARTVRSGLKTLFARHPHIELRTASEVTAIEPRKGGYSITCSDHGQERTQGFGAVINATYANVNAVNKLAGMPTPAYQYELCEEPVIRVPWKKKFGLAVMDGPFFGLMPFGFSDEYLLYDVEISVLERHIADVPKFVHDVAFYDQPALRLERFRRYVEKVKPYIPEIARCEYLYSLYAVRIVLAGHEKDDARPTVVLNPAPGFWTIFSGKFLTCVSSARKLAREVHQHLQ